ncbi:MAG: DUF1805 domain-containing protein [Victivallaceae bacterium]|nr:DUF1805 domain-containing protein [Victivallaceae bacterium]
MEKIIIDGKDFEAWRIPTESAAILLIKAVHGFIGCGYFDVETANKLQEHAGIVTGVKTFDDMLEAKIIKCSNSAETVGVRIGMTGREALLKLN